MNISFVGSNALAAELGPDGAGVFVTQVVPLPTDGSIPIVASYLNALSAYSPDAVPGFVSLEGYLAGRLAIAGLEICGRDVDRTCFLDSLRGAHSIDLDGFRLGYGEQDNQGSDAVLSDGNRRRRPLPFHRQFAGRSAVKEFLKGLLDSRFRISGQLNLAIWGAVALTVCASLVGWLSFNRVGDVQSHVNEGSIPDMAASFGVAQYSAILVAAAPRLTATSTTEEFDQVALDISEAHRAFEEQLALLEDGGTGKSGLAEVRTRADSLLSNIGDIKEETRKSFILTESSAALGTELTQLRTQLDSIVVPAIDNQLFYTMTGYRDLGQPPAPRSRRLSEQELLHYRHLSQLQVDGNIAMELLANAFTLSQASLLEPLRERFEAAASRIERSLAALEGSPLRDQVSPIFTRLFELGIGEGSVFNLQDRLLTLTETQQALVVNNRNIAIDLVEDVNGLVNTARASAQSATQASSDAILTGRTLLLAISGISVAGALLIAWLFVGRILVRRLKLLSDWMRRMAGGDLEARVEIEGRDEVAEMAAALEVFRRHALEVQRLNLVEQLAEELRGKNDELEVVLQDLQSAQDQIVMREKLAALGELTAGVAHEIRNPLNFVNNFSEVSQELIKELEEVLQEEGATLTDEQTGLVGDIFGDLRDNLDRIRSHGERAKPDSPRHASDG